MVSKVRNVRLGVFSGGGCDQPNEVKNLIYKLLMADYSILALHSKSTALA